MVETRVNIETSLRDLELRRLDAVKAFDLAVRELAVRGRRVVVFPRHDAERETCGIIIAGSSNRIIFTNAITGKGRHLNPGYDAFATQDETGKWTYWGSIHPRYNQAIGDAAYVWESRMDGHVIHRHAQTLIDAGPRQEVARG